jgi:hypothetical protein
MWNVMFRDGIQGLNVECDVYIRHVMFRYDTQCLNVECNA